MNDYFIYLIKVSAGMMLFGLPYYLLLRREPNLRLKRLYLISGLILSFIFPILHIQIPSLSVSEMPVFFIDIQPPSSLQTDAGMTADTTQSTGFGWEKLVMGIYLGGVVLMFLRTVISVISWKHIREASSNEDNNLLYSDRNEAFTYFKYIHLPNSFKDFHEQSPLLFHEEAHIRQYHFLDLILAEIAILFTWFNPFTWLIIRMIKENHEHLADKEALERGVDPARYRAQLLNMTLGVPVFSFGQSFNHSLTKKRFEMMKTKKSKRSGLVKILFILSLVIMPLSLLSSKQAEEGKITGRVSFSDTNEPAPGVSIVINGTTIGTVADIDGTFELNVPGECELVFSFVGYQTQKIPVTPGKKLNVHLSPKIYEIELDYLGIEDRARDKAMPGSKSDPVYIVDGKKVEGFSDLDTGAIKVNLYKDPEVIAEKFPEYTGHEAVLEITTKKQEEKPVQKEEKEIFYIVEDMPEFPGGLKELQQYMYKNLQYPEKARRQKKEGKVLVKFNIKADGTVDSSEVIQSSDKVFNASALDLFNSMPDWKPGKQRGKPVKVTFTVPVYFKITGN